MTDIERDAEYRSLLRAQEVHVDIDELLTELDWAAERGEQQ